LWSDIVKKFFKWTGLVVAALAGLVLVAIVSVYALSAHQMHRQYAVSAPTPLTLPTDAAEIAEGKRLAHVTGCTHCHTENLTGAVPLEIPNVVRFVAPNITAIAPKYTDAQLIALLRQGVKLDGTSVYFMPSEMFRHLDDVDLARIIAWVRSVPAATGITGQTEVHLIGRAIIASGQFKSAAEEIQQHADAPATGLGAAAAHGRYLVMSSCTECHGQDLEGNAGAKAPPLSIAKSYSAEQFSKLMHEGVPLGGQPLELMSPTAKARFAVLTARETADIYDFLTSR
jgi:cytochrome c553